MPSDLKCVCFCHVSWVSVPVTPYLAWDTVYLGLYFYKSLIRRKKEAVWGAKSRGSR